MSFLNNIFLWGLAAAALPILIHLFFRRRRTKIEFSTVAFFRPRQRFLSHRRRLRELLLLLLRTLAVALLALALARPVMRSLPYHLNTRTDLALVLDDTLSMDRKTAAGGRAFELARSKALELLETLQSGDGAAVVFVSGRAGLGLSRNQQQVLSLVRGATGTAASGSFSTALQTATNALAGSSSPNRELYVISDLQENQLPSEPLRLATEKLRLFLLAVGGTEENLALGELRLSGKPKIVNQPVRIPFAVRNGGQHERGTEAQLLVNGEQVAKRFLNLPAGATVRDAFEYVPSAAGFISGQVAITDNELTLDNQQYFAAEVAEKVKVLLLESDLYSKAQPYFYLRHALAPPGSNLLNGFELETMFVAELTPLLLRTYPVVVLANPAPLTADQAAILRDHLLAGGTVLSFAGTNVGPETFAAFTVPRVRAWYGAKDESNAVGLRFAGPLAGLNEILELDLVKWRRLQQLWPGQPAGLVLATVDQRPVLAEERVGDGRWVAAAFDARRDYSNWPELKSFPVAMIHLFDYAANAPHRIVVTECGRPLRLAADQTTVRLSMPAGQVLKLTAVNHEARYDETWLPGLLKCEGTAATAAVLAPAPTESDLKVVRSEAGAKRLIAARMRVLNTEADLAWQVRSYREGSDLAGLALLVLALVLVAEAAIGSGYVLTGRRG